MTAQIFYPKADKARVCPETNCLQILKQHAIAGQYRYMRDATWNNVETVLIRNITGSRGEYYYYYY